MNFTIHIVQLHTALHAHSTNFHVREKNSTPLPR